MPDCPSECRWDSEILVNARRAHDGFTMGVLVRRAAAVSEFDLRSPTHVLSLPLAGSYPRLEGRLDGRQLVFDMHPGHVLLRPAGQRHHGLCRGGGTFRYVMLAFEPELVAQATDGGAEIGAERDIARPEVVQAMAALAEASAPGGRLLAETLVTAILLELARHRIVRDEAYVAAAGRSARELRRVAEYIEENLHEDLSLFTLAREAGLSPAHLTRELKRVTGLAPHQYLLRRRVERARTLLAQRERSIGEIALAVGFSSQAHLGTVFRQVYGLTPGQYRAELGRA